MTTTNEQPVTATTKGEKGTPGRPNGRTERQRKLRAMTKDQRKAHRQTWRASLKSNKRVAAPPAATTASPVSASKPAKKGK